MTQFVPSDTKVAQFPTTPKRIAVPAVVLSSGTTSLDAETSVWACIFLKINCRPIQLAAAGKVTVQVEPDLLLIIQASPFATAKLAVLVTGADTVLTAGVAQVGVPAPALINVCPAVPAAVNA